MIIEEKLKNANIKLLPNRLFYDPTWLVLGVNNICNLHCKMCDVGIGYTESNFYANLMGSHPINMPLELIKRIIDQAALYFPKVKLGYAFTEPLIYPYLLESLSYANQHKLYTSITTNALTLKKVARDLANTGLNEIFVSLDGPEEIHNKIRGHKSSFQRAMEGIHELISLPKYPKISVFCTITEWNVGYLMEFIGNFKDIPLKELGFMHTNFTPDFVVEKHNAIYGNNYPATKSNVNEIDLHKIDLNLLLKEIKAIKQISFPFPITFSPEIDSLDKLELFYHQPEKLFGKKCWDVFKNLMIKSDGTVIPAHGRCYNITIGNLYEQNLKDIWNSSAISQLRKTLNEAGGLFPGCSRCCSAFS